MNGLRQTKKVIPKSYWVIIIIVLNLMMNAGSKAASIVEIWIPIEKNNKCNFIEYPTLLNSINTAKKVLRNEMRKLAEKWNTEDCPYCIRFTQSRTWGWALRLLPHI